MCGIAGYVVKDGEARENLLSLSSQLKKRLKHRGPDSEGEFIDESNGVLLSHTRLSIIDLSESSSQPFYSDDREIVLVYNGEIYNYLELREELRSSGCVFKTNGDTEVILRAYERWGEGAFSRFVGMFAFCIYDRRKKEIYLARDRIGIKPFYYYYNGKSLQFSSEMRVFSSLSENEDWRIYFLTFGFIPEPYTTKQGVVSLNRGSFLRLDLKSFSIETRTYKGIEFNLTGSSDISNSDAINRTSELFRKAIKRHLISDAPLGVFLSGGIDSSLISIIAAEERKEQITTLSVQFKEAEYTEERFQNIVANQIHSNHWAHLFTMKDFYESLDDIRDAMDSPSIDGINTYFVSRMAKLAGCKTVLSGLGGDELFMGYGSFGLIDRLNSIRMAGIPIRRVIQNLGWMLSIEKYRKLSLLGYENPIFFYLLFRCLFIPKDVGRILNIDRKIIIDKIASLYQNGDKRRDMKNWLSDMEFRYYMLGQLLRDTDYMSMWHSVETRVPFLDNELVDFVATLPSSFKYNEKKPKYLICEAFRQNLPEEIVFRRKQGFTFPFDIWIRENIGFFKDMAYRGGEREFSEKLFDRFIAGQTNFSRIWALVVMNIKKW